MLQGYKTWIGLVLTILGAVGIFEKLGVTKEEVSQIIDTVMQLVGLVLASYGNYKSHQKISELEEY